MVFLDEGRTEIRNFLAGGSVTAPSKMIWGTTSATPQYTDSSILGVVFTDSFVSVESSVDRQVQFEGILLTTEATSSTLRQVAIGTETSGTAGVLYIKESFADINKNNTFDLQTLVIAEITREDGT